MSTSSPQRRWPVVVLVACGVVLVCLCLAGAAGGAYFYFRGRGGTSAEPTIEYILDASPRMDSPSSAGEPRIVVARGVLGEIVRTADPRLTAGLRVFGTGALPQGCEDTDLIVPLAASNQGEIEGTLADVEAAPESDSGVAQAMVAAIRDMASTDGPHSIVIVTGGADTCNPEAGELIRQEADRAGIELKMFVIGFEVPPDEVEAVKALVDLIPGATYTDAPNPQALQTALAGIQDEVDRTAVEAFEPAPEPSGFTSAHACDHPYLPLRTGATWTFSGTEGTLTWVVTSAGGTADSASATMDFSFPGGTTTVHWGCGPEGITSYDFGSFSGADFVDALTFEVVDSAGAWFPAPELMVPGYSWSNEYTMNMTSAIEGASFTVSAATSQSFTVTGVETVSLADGSHDAIRIDGTSTTTTTAADLPIPIPEMTWNETFWMVEGVGIVRYSTSGEGYTSSGELTSYSIP